MAKRILLTGPSGTIGQILWPHLIQIGYEVIPWERDAISTRDYHMMEQFISEHKPEAFIHLAAITSFSENERKESWHINYEWPCELAWICKTHGIRFIFTSTAMVFSAQNQGPYTSISNPDATEGYGFEKRMAEEKGMLQNNDSVILRLGWQISETGDNSMISFLQKQMELKAEIQASTAWFPSCSFIQDTVEVIGQSLDFKPGIYMVNSNTELNFFEIASFLNNQYAKNWNIIATEDYIHDQRMIDKRIKIQSLKQHFNT